MAEAEKYYANILMPYGMQMKKTIPVIEGLDISLIAPSHGVMWRSHIEDIIKAYKHYCDETPDKKAVVVLIPCGIPRKGWQGLLWKALP